MHAIVFFEELPGQCNQLALRGMVNCLPTDEVSGEFGAVLFDIVTEIRLSRVAANNQHLAYACQRTANLVKKFMLSSNAAAMLACIVLVITYLFGLSVVGVKSLNQRVVMVNRNDGVAS